MTVTLDLGKRIAEAVLFAAEEPLDLVTIQAHLPGDLHARDVIDALKQDYDDRRGIRLEEHGGRYAFRTAPDIGPYLQREKVQRRQLSKAALETLAIIAYHQPITRAEIEEVRGVTTNKGTLDILIETGWVQPKGRRETPGRPVTWVTTTDFLDHLDLTALDDLPRIEELMQVGLLSNPSVERNAPSDNEDEGGDENGEVREDDLGHGSREDAEQGPLGDRDNEPTPVDIAAKTRPSLSVSDEAS